MWQGVVTTALAATELLSIEDARAQCRVDGTDQDTLLESYLFAAQEWIEGECGIRCLAQTIELRTDCWDDLPSLPIGPIVSVTSVSYLARGIATAWTGWAPRSLGTIYPGLTVPHAGGGPSWPAKDPGSTIVITAVAGYGATLDDVPRTIQLAAKVLVGSMFDNGGVMSAEAMNAAGALLRRSNRLGF